MKKGWSKKMIQQVYRVGNSTLSDIRARHEEELRGLANPNATEAHERKLKKRKQQYHETKGLPAPKAQKKDCTSAVDK